METTFMFYGKPITVIANGGEFYVSVRHICEGIGIASNMQIKKVRANSEVLRGYDIISPSAGGGQTTFCIPLARLNLWLCSISPSKVHPDIRAELIKYQCECADVLYRHFLQKEPTWDLEGFVSQVRIELQNMNSKLDCMQQELKSVKAALNFTFGDESPIIMSLIRDVADAEGVGGREVWGDVQAVLDVQSYKRMNRRIINYLKNRKDGSGLKLVSGGV